MDFENFCENFHDTKQEKPQPKTEQKTEKQTFDDADIKEKIERYQSLNSSQLMTELLKEVNKQKSSGNLTNEKLESMMNEISAFLDEEQKNKLQDILKMLR